MSPFAKIQVTLENDAFRGVYFGADSDRGGGGTPQYQMDTGVRLTLPKAGAFGENTVSKNEGSLDEKPNFGSKLGGIW